MRPISTIYLSSRFVRALANLPIELSLEVAERQTIFQHDCFDPRLKTHQLSGRLKGHWAFSITYKHRVMFCFLDDHTVRFEDVGDHSIYR